MEANLIFHGVSPEGVFIPDFPNEQFYKERGQ